MSEDSVNSGRKNGRPKKGEPPRIPYDELDRILVFGEVVTCDDGKNTTVVYPSYRDLARRYGVSNSLIAQYSKQHNCLRRREVAQERIKVKADQKLVELRATAVALSKDDTLRMIDSFLLGFEKALAEGRVRYDNPTDFNTMVRLKEFVMGGADSRQEVHAALSLEDIQARHQRMLRKMRDSSAGERGVLPPSEGGQKKPGCRSVFNSPAPSPEAAPGEMTTRLPRPADYHGQALDAGGPQRRLSRAGPADTHGWAGGSENAPQGANVGHCRPNLGPWPARDGLAAGETVPIGREPMAEEAASRGEEKVCEEYGRVFPPVAEPVLEENRGSGKPRASAELRRYGMNDRGFAGPSVSPEGVLPGESGKSLEEHWRVRDEHEESIE